MGRVIFPATGVRSRRDGRTRTNSLLHASSLALDVVERQGATAGYLDPADATTAFYEQLERLLAGGSCKVLCISTSTAATEETARIARLAREACGCGIQIIVGGPHEDACTTKVAQRIPEVDASLAGDSEEVLAAVLEAALQGRPPLATLQSLEAATGPVTATCRSARGFWQGRVAAQASGRRHRPILERGENLPALGPGHTNEVMLRTGCTYGRCTFCAEGSSERDARRTLATLDFLQALAARNPSGTFYFQDSIFPNNDDTKNQVLPWLRDNGTAWGCQLYLNALSRDQVRALAAHGCRYIYTGLESASEKVLSSIGKQGLSVHRAAERLDWIADAGMSVGISLMFGAMSTAGALIEDECSLAATVAFAQEVVSRGVPVVGYYPNVQTVLPGTPLAIGLRAAGHEIDFYRMPRQPIFSGLEDGGIGYNFTTIPGMPFDVLLAESIAQAARTVESLTR